MGDKGAFSDLAECVAHLLPALTIRYDVAYLPKEACSEQKGFLGDGQGES